MIGETIGNFKIVSRLGRGGMGEVWLAEQQSIGTRVAIKLLNADISEDTEHVQRFFNEARAVSRIQHAGIVKIFDVGHHAGHAYLIMEYLEGETLAKRIARIRHLPVGELADIGRQIASVLDATHSAGITHRDLKPDNIYLVADRELPRGERVKVLDFGIAKLTGTLAVVSPRTTGTMGTPAYMAPEQWGDASKVDWRADLYSLGCVTFEMACGRPPFIVTNIAEACAKHLHDPPPHVKEVVPEAPADLDALVDRLLAKTPTARASSMRDVERAFAALASGQPVALADTIAASVAARMAPSVDAAHATSAPTPVPTTRTRTRWPVIAAGAILALVGLGFLGLSIRDRQRPVHVVSPRHERVAETPTDALPPAAAPQASAAAPADAGVADAPRAAVGAPLIRKHPVNVAPLKEGTIDADGVFRTYADDRLLRRCYTNEVAKDATLAGRMKVMASIDTAGRMKVISARADAGAHLSSKVMSCVRTRLEQLQYPQPIGGPVTVNIPITFEAPTPEEMEHVGTLSSEAHAAGSLPATPSQRDIRAGMHALLPELQACAASAQGTGRAEMTIAPDGHVSKAVITGALHGTDGGACVVKALLEHAKFAESEHGIHVTYPIDLRSP